MTANEFDTLCSDRLIDPAIALESDAIRKALADRDDRIRWPVHHLQRRYCWNKVIEILDSEF